MKTPVCVTFQQAAGRLGSFLQNPHISVFLLFEHNAKTFISGRAFASLAAGAVKARCCLLDCLMVIVIRAHAVILLWFRHHRRHIIRSDCRGKITWISHLHAHLPLGAHISATCAWKPVRTRLLYLWSKEGVYWEVSIFKYLWKISKTLQDWKKSKLQNLLREFNNKDESVNLSLSSHPWPHLESAHYKCLPQ